MIKYGQDKVKYLKKGRGDVEIEGTSAEGGIGEQGNISSAMIEHEGVVDIGSGVLFKNVVKSGGGV